MSVLKNHCFARPGFGAVAVVTFVFQRIPAYTFAGFCICCLLHLHGFCICWFLRSKSDAFAKFCTELLLFFAIDGCRICYFLHGLLIFFVTAAICLLSSVFAFVSHSLLPNVGSQESGVNTYALPRFLIYLSGLDCLRKLLQRWQRR